MDTEVTFGEWLRQRRRMLDLTQRELAQQIGCAVVTIRKFESNKRRPSKELAGRLATCLNLASEEYDNFIAFARAEPYLEAVSPPAVPVDSLPWTPPAAPQKPQIPKKLGRYEILTPIGRGGFATVYHARDTELDRPVALKVLRANLLADTDWVERFRQEARVIAHLDHPRIVAIYDVGQAEGCMFIVMRLVDGPGLDAWLAGRGRLPWSEAVEVVKVVAEGLDYAHGQGILHRDLKPANILMDPERGPLLSDFGLAKLVGENSLTQRGHIVGTPHYIAPEIWDSQPATPQTDIYALSCILYELLTGQKLFQGRTPPAVMAAHFGPLALPETWPEGVPSGLTNVLRASLAKQPDNRYATAGEMVAALTRPAEAGLKVAAPDEGLPAGEAMKHREEETFPLSHIQSGSRHNLPVKTTPFIGREAELAELARLLDDPAIRLVTILGPGGIGKTRLALEATAFQLNNFSHGVYFVSLASLEVPEAIVPTIADALNFSFYRGGTQQQQLLNYLCQKSVLLVLDNFEHLLEGADLVIELLQVASKLKILVTSRAKLNLQEEQLFWIGGIDFPAAAAETSEAAAQSSAVKLFWQSARRVEPGFKLTADNLTNVTQICRLVQGMPLGILLAAAWVEILTPAEIAKEISQGLDFLETDWRDLPERQRSIRAVFDHSWQLLTEQEREVYQQLSVFRGGFSRQAAQEVTGTSLRTLMVLVNKSLLHRMSTDRYQMHELLRQYAAEQLIQSPAASEAVRDRHSAYYATALRQREHDLKGTRQQKALAEIEADIENARAAWNWAAARGQVEYLGQALDSLCHFYEWRVRYQEGEAACRLAASKLAKGQLAVITSGDGSRILAKILAWQSLFNRLIGQIEAADLLVRQSLVLLDSPELASQDTRPEKAFVLLQIGYIVLNADCEKAKNLYEQSLALYQALDDPWGTADALAALGDVAHRSSAYEEAKHLREESLAIRQALGNQRGMASLLSSLSFTAVYQGHFEEAERLARESNALYQEIGDRDSIANGLGKLGTTLFWLGKFDESHSLQEESLAIHNDLGNRRASIRAHTSLGGAKSMLGKYEEARIQLQIALTIAREVGSQAAIGWTLWILGWTAVAMEAYAEAQQFAQESVAIYREIGQRSEMGWSLATLGYAVRGLGNISQAQRYLTNALRTAVEVREISGLIYVLPAIALLLADRGEIEQAVELYALVSRYPIIGNSQFFEDVAGQHITAVAATLPPEVIAVAQERGKVRDLWTTAEELLELWAVPAFMSDDTAPPTPPFVFVARERELAELEATLATARAGQGQILFVIGGAGRGKTMLVREFARRAQAADPELIAISGHCNVHTGLGDPYLPFREALTLLTGDVEAKWAGGLISQAQARRLWEVMPLTLPALVEYAPDLIDSFVSSKTLQERAVAFASPDAAWFSRLSSIVSDENRANLEQKRIFAQYTAILKAIATQRPLLLIIEDLHWVDTSSSDLLFHLSREIGDSRILLVGTYRPEEVALSGLTSGSEHGERHPLAGIVSELKRRHGDIWLDLGKMAQTEGRRFVETYLDTQPNRLSQTFRAELFQHTGGHALFTVELLREMRDRGDIRQDENGLWVEGEAIDWQKLPAKIEGVIERRINRLEESLQAVLTIASVEGETFTAEVVARVQHLNERGLVQRLSRELDKQHRLVMAEALERLAKQRLSIYRFRHQLFQHYLYQHLDETERAYLHEEVGTVLETLYGEQTEKVAVQLARHFEIAGLTDKAIAYLRQAGERASRLSAYEEAIGHLGKGLELLKSLPDTLERSQQELDLQLALGPALRAVKGYAVLEVEQAYTRARELCQQLGETPQILPVLWGLWSFYMIQAEHQTAFELAKQSLTLAQRQEDPVPFIMAHRFLGATLYWFGDLPSARSHLEQGIALYDFQHHHSQVVLYGHDAGVNSLAYAALALWVLGYPDQALKWMDEAIDLAQELSHPFSMGFAFIWAAWLHIYRREGQAAQERAEAAITLSTERGLSTWGVLGIIWRGIALAEQEQAEEGLVQMRQGLTAWRTPGAEAAVSYFLTQLAMTYGKAGQVEEGLTVLAEALASIEKTDERFWEAEMHRIKGELLLQDEGSRRQGEELAGAKAEVEAEKCFRQAIAIACRQEAKSLELRATVSLARLWQSQGKQAEARQILAEIYGWFSEGFDTADLREAKELLVALW